MKVANRCFEGTTFHLVSANNHPSGADSTEFAIEVVPIRDGLTRLRIQGELDLLSSPQLSETLERELIDASEVVLDLSEVQFVDSAGLQAVIGAIRLCDENGAALTINSTLAPQAQRLFELAGVIDRLPLAEG